MNKEFNRGYIWGCIWTAIAITIVTVILTPILTPNEITIDDLKISIDLNRDGKIDIVDWSIFDGRFARERTN